MMTRRNLLWMLLVGFAPLSSVLAQMEMPALELDFSSGAVAQSSGGTINHVFYKENVAAEPTFREAEGQRGLSLDGSEALLIASKGLRFSETGFVAEITFVMEEKPTRGLATLASQAGRFSIGIQADGRLSASLLSVPQKITLTSTGQNRARLGMWTTARFAYDGRVATLYLDGKAVAEEIVAGTIAGSSNSVVVGGQAKGSDLSAEPLAETFKGLIGKVQILRPESGP